VDAVALALRSAAAPGETGSDLPEDGDPRPAVVAQLRSTLPPGEPGRVTGRLPTSGRRTGEDPSVEIVAVSGYDPGDRLDGWYDALLASVGAAATDVPSAARAVVAILSGLPETGVPHDGVEVCAVLEGLVGDRRASGP
jgi:hypothetical protein